ncbi:DUF6397 family protein [Streptomyces ipomoeae]|uniref:DUF6397 family protein n=1 Tax=Streptomyces ipomoeae TaxID=103232 RepID=UPI0011466625|nr:DUF6397 family protein [Streptomyces ipomoeae]MDX2934986.1 DUF6397 family protein [Streptomyces ipomoeae]TQE16748.1 hypothetical protein SipoB123_39495 [Streptomyces ipomoeae]
MSGHTITQPATSTTPVAPSTPTVAPAPAGATGRPLTQSRAARELGLKRGELDLAVQLGCVRTVLDDGGGGRRVARAEIDRIRAEEGFPEALRQRVETVGTRIAAEILDVTAARFMRVARLGLVTPVKFYLNRYRAVVWLYLAEEVRQFAADENNTAWLKGRIPEELRNRLYEGLDLRPRNWRGRHLGFLLRHAEDPWARAAAPASLLDPVQVAEIVQDPYERAYLNRHRPARPDQDAPDSPAAQLTARIMTADDPDEIAWLRADLQQSLAEARAHRLAPRPRRKAPAPHLPENTRRPAKRRPTPTTGPDKRHGLLGWLRRRHP